MGEQGPQQSSHNTIIRGGDGSIDHRQRHLQILSSTHKLSLSRNRTQLKVTHKQVMVQKFHELLQISAKVNFRDKNCDHFKFSGFIFFASTLYRPTCNPHSNLNFANKIFVILRIFTKFTKILCHENLELYGKSIISFPDPSWRFERGLGTRLLNGDLSSTCILPTTAYVHTVNRPFANRSPPVSETARSGQHHWN